MVMETMQIRLTKGLVEEIKTLVDRGIYPNSSECVRDAVRRLITGAGGKMEVPEQEKVINQIKEQVKDNFQKPTGTTDFFPEEMSIKNHVFNVLRSTANNFGFNEVETPAFENLNLLTKKSGEEILGQIFTLEQKGKERQNYSDISLKEDEKFGLRFDLTVPITRMFIAKQKEITKPAKWFGLSRMWRYERPQAGRLREFYQLSVELFGCDKPDADAEIINLAVNCLKNFGLTDKDFFVKVNNRKLLQGVLQSIIKEYQIEALIRLIDKSKKITDEEFDKEAKKFNIVPKDIRKILKCKNLKDIEELKLNKLAKEGLEELKVILNLVDKKYIEFDISIARGLAYYSGTVFEIYDREEKLRAIAGGGRYNELVELLGGSPCSAVGFGMGYSTLTLLLTEKGVLPAPEIEVDYFVVMFENVKKEALEIVQELRQKYKVSYDLAGRNMKKQINYASKINAKNVIIIGEEEIKSGMLSIKDMNTGKQTKVSLDIL